MIILNFKKIALEDIDILNKYLSQQEFRSSLYTLGVLYYYEDYFSPEYAIIDDTLLIRCKDQNGESNYLYPLGKNSKDLALSLSKITYAPESVKEDLKDNYKSELIPDWFDYLYKYDDLVNLSGKKYQKIRNHINRFLNTYHDYHYETISPDNFKDVVKIIYAVKPITEGGKQELNRVKRWIDSYFSFPFIGGILYVKNEPVAFSFGEVIKDTLHVQIEKTIKTFDGAGDMQRNLFLKLFKDQNIVFVNRQEDLGDPGLRFQKRSLNPCALLNKYDLKKL